MKVYPIEKPGKKKKNKRGLPPAQRDKVYREVIERDGVCQNPFCSAGWPLSIPHHVVKKSQYGPDCSSNLVLLCCECHDLIHSRGKLKVTGKYPNFFWEKNTDTKDIIYV